MISGLPSIKSIDKFDFTFQPGLNKQKVMSLFDLTFIRQRGNVIFLGPPGVGKTHLAVALAVKACQSGLSVYFTTMEDLIGKLRKDHETGRSGRGEAITNRRLWSLTKSATRPSTGRNAIFFSGSLPTAMRRPALS